MTPETWKLIASIGGVLITVVTGPMIWAMRAESKAIRMEFKADLAETEKRLSERMAEMEKRLNERIDTRLVHR